MTLVTRSTETSNGNFADSSIPFTVTLSPILDPIDVTNTSQVVNETWPSLSAQPSASIWSILDGSQNLSYTISGIPNGFNVFRTLQGATTIPIWAAGLCVSMASTPMT